MEGSRRGSRNRHRAAALGFCLVVVGSVVFAAAPSQAAVVSTAPRTAVATAFDGKVVVRWQVPRYSGTSRVTKYRIRVLPTNQLIVVPANRLNATIGNLKDGKAYSFTVSSLNAAGWSGPSPATTKVHPTRPNILLILTDDQRWDAMTQLPATNALPLHRFTRSFVDEPMCCPSRASTLTGRLPTHTKVDTNTTGARLDPTKTFATMLHKHGYQTVFAGKYLNGYPFGRAGYKPPGWEKFYGLTGALMYYDYSMIENGKEVNYGSADADYSTDVLKRKIIDAAKAADPNRPLLLDFAPNAPHRAGLFDPVPARRHIGKCANKSLPLPLSFNAYDSVSEPNWMAGELPRDPLAIHKLQQATCETLLGVDEAVTDILAELERSGRLANTYVVLTSDNGYHFGEHRLMEKGDLYEESVRVPLVVAGPGVVKGNDARLTSNIDLAPTFLEWAQIPPPANFFDGVSFAASAAGSKKPGPTAVLLHGCRTVKPAQGQGACGGYDTAMGMPWGLRTGTYKYVEYSDGEKQLFNVLTDPYELKNLAPDPAYSTTMTSLHNRIIAMGGGT